ncbi:hypothetical protein M405DRAFT_826242 [Rhizopogon salebrosus TDB-379]|nr:hypothetical protein M405DRAFT_826242 [Rhizopogon salebrosus TDB-379]
MAPVAIYSSTVVTRGNAWFSPFLLVESSRTTNLEPSSIARSLWEPRTLPSIIAYSSKPIDNRGGATLLEGTRESSRQIMLCLCSIPAMYIHTFRTTIHPPHPIRDSRVERYICANRSIDRGCL